MPVFHFCDS